jgi:hypothetical protein
MIDSDKFRFQMDRLQDELEIHLTESTWRNKRNEKKWKKERERKEGEPKFSRPGSVGGNGRLC